MYQDETQNEDKKGPIAFIDKRARTRDGRAASFGNLNAERPLALDSPSNAGETCMTDTFES